jgi:hypothetical protein
VLEIAEEFGGGATSINPNYHKPTDTVSTLDLKFHAEVTRATLGALSTLGNQP